MNRSIAVLALVLLALPFTPANLEAAGPDEPEGGEASAAAAPPSLGAPSDVSDTAQAQATCPGFSFLKLFPAGEPQQSCVAYCTAGGGTFGSYDTSNRLYWVCTCCAGS